MVELVKPNRQHQYVVGIDFGHGETSAAICELQWNMAAGHANMDPVDIRINERNTGNEKVLVSAISIVNGEQPQIGENAFDSKQLDENAAIRVCFKQPPVDVNGEAEQLMVTYMSAVYKKIREMQPELTDTNHVVYIARPSGWTTTKQKDLYKQMALYARIPLAGLTSESRAAIFYALNAPNIGFTKQLEQGAIVFDLGSSTLDFTYLSNEEKPIDYGYPLGASIIDRAIFEDKILSNDKVQMLLQHNPQYENALLFKARQIKEDIYKKEDNSEIDQSFLLGTIVSRGCNEYQQLKREFVEIEYANIDDLNQSIENKSQYISKLKEALIDFQQNHITGKTIHGVFLTGGASRMKFIQDLICRTYNLKKDQVRVDPDNPSLTISRGIAMLGRADSVSEELVASLQKKIKGKDISYVYNNFITTLSNQICNSAWEIVETELRRFKDSNIDMSVNDLEANIRNAIQVYANSSLSKQITSAIQSTISSSAEDIRKELNQIISFYAPGKELKPLKQTNSEVQTKEIEQQINSLVNKIIDSITEQVTDNISEIITDVLWDLFWTVLFGVYYWAYRAAKWGWDQLTKTEAERRAEERRLEREKKEETKQKKLEKETRVECFQKITEQSANNKNQLLSSIQMCLSNNNQLRNLLEPEIKKYSTAYVKQNIESVRIPIE